MPRVRRSPAEESAGFFVWQQFCIFAAVKKRPRFREVVPEFAIATRLPRGSGAKPLSDKKKRCFRNASFLRVDDRTRTDNIQNHNLGL